MGFIKTFRRRLKRLHPLYTEIERINKRLDKIYEIIDPEGFYTNGERQVASSLDKVRPDHLGRYEFATKYITAGMNVLDIACGTGYGSFVMAKSMPAVNVLGVDISEQAIDYANHFYKTENVKFIIDDCHKVELPASFYDVVVSFETIEHIEDADTFVKKLYACIKPGGYLICSTPNESRLRFSKKDFPHHLRHYNLSEFESLVENAGFEIESRLSQHARNEKIVSEDSEGLYHIFVCKRMT